VADKIDDGGPAFPRPHSVDGSGDYPQQQWASEGMSLRDYFAIHAPEPTEVYIKFVGDNTNLQPLEIIARFKFGYADAMIAQRKVNG